MSLHIDAQSTANAYRERFLDQLLGYEIVAVEMVPIGGEWWPTLILDKPAADDAPTLVLTVCQDAEGNGPGHVDIGSIGPIHASDGGKRMKLYRGTPERRNAPNDGNPYGFEVEVRELVGESEVGETVTKIVPLRHVVRHSPDGFAWGYAGSGPSELARCLLIDVLGPCPRCGGDGIDAGLFGRYREELMAEGMDADEAREAARKEMRRSCDVCDGEGFDRRVGGLYQRFKVEVVAKWPMQQSWEITDAEIRDWIEQAEVKA